MIFETLEQGRDGESAKIVEDGDLGSGLFSLWMSITPVNDRSFDLSLSLSLGLCQCKVHYLQKTGTGTANLDSREQ